MGESNSLTQQYTAKASTIQAKSLLVASGSKEDFCDQNCRIQYILTGKDFAVLSKIMTGKIFECVQINTYIMSFENAYKCLSFTLQRKKI